MTNERPSLWFRSRWTAIGAAVAVTIGYGGVKVASATIVSGQRNVFVPIVPCRLVDTRPAPTTVGFRAVPIVAAEEFRAQVTGINGDCAVSASARAVVLNLTALDATGGGFITVWPASSDRPNTSNINFSAGQAPVANAVTVQIDNAGAVKFYTSATSVNIIADIVGYYQDHDHNDQYVAK